MHYIGNSGSRINIKQLADWLVERSNETTPVNAINELTQYNNSKEVTVYGIMLLTAIYIDYDYTFCNGVQIVKESSIPNKKIALEISNLQFNSILPLPRIQSVFIVPYTHKVFHISDEDNEQSNYFTNMPIGLLQDTKLCLILARQLSGVHSISYSTIIPDNLPLLSSSSGWVLESTKQPDLLGTVIEIELKWADELLSKFKNLEPSLKEKLTVSIESLNSYCSLAPIVERAISLRTCLESIFLDDGNKEQLSYRLGLRGALFLGSDLKEKKEIMKTLRTTYSITSSAVHEGKLSEKQRKNIDFLKDSAKLANKAIVKIINDGQVNWEELELN